MTRYFVHFAAHSPHEFIDKAEARGSIVEVKMHADPRGGMVYGSAEIDPILTERGDQHGNEDR